MHSSFLILNRASTWGPSVPVEDRQLARRGVFRGRVTALGFLKRLSLDAFAQPGQPKDIVRIGAACRRSG